jgi:pimeloyl-ACP methyl ester carboxylesterase
VELLPHGTEVDGCSLDGWLGEGGMSVVYRAQRDTRTVALKLLKDSTPEVSLRLLQEGRVQRELAHPNIVAVTGAVEHDGSPGLVLEYVPGPSLDQVSLPRSIEVIDRLAADLFAGVGAAHARGFIHRDLKPANVLLDPRAGEIRARISDFGLSKVLDGDTSLRTRSRATLGTPAYMAPEQTEDSRRVDERTDVFALGVILYELLAGERPFGGSNVARLFAAIQAGERRSLDEAAPEAPRRMRSAVERALAVDPDDRFETVEAFAQAWSVDEEGACWSAEEREEVAALFRVRALPRRPSHLFRRRGVRARVADAVAHVALGVPRLLTRRPRQKIEAVTTKDGVRLAFARTGSGPVVVYVLGWATHLSEGITSPLYDRDRIIRDMSRSYSWVRFDGRGSGLSERRVGPMSLATRVLDLQAVVDAVSDEPVSLVGFSSGVPTSIAYASAHPERVRRLVLMSGMLRPRIDWDDELRAEVRTMLPLVQRHWEDPDSAYRTWLVSKIEPHASAVEARVLAEFLRIAMNGEDFAAFSRSDADFDVEKAARGLDVPTLVLHNTRDPFYPSRLGGQAVADAIPGARLVLIESDRHILSAATDRRAFERTWRLAREFLAAR